jgi:hypothetical protein
MTSFGELRRVWPGLRAVGATAGHPTEASGPTWPDAVRASGSRFSHRVAGVDEPVTADATALRTMRDHAWLRAASGRVAEAMGAPRPVIADGLLLYGLVVPLVVPVVAGLMHTGGLLITDLDRSSVTLLANGSVERLWLRAGGTPPLVIDEPADRAIADAAELVRELVAPMAAAATDALRIGRRQVWRLVGDLTVRTTHDVLRDEDRTRRLSQQFLTACGTPIDFEPQWEHVHTGRSVVVRPRTRSCCLGYQIDGMAYCAGCPREAEPSRTARLAAYLAAHPA